MAKDKKEKKESWFAITENVGEYAANQQQWRTVKYLTIGLAAVGLLYFIMKELAKDRGEGIGGQLQDPGTQFITRPCYPSESVCASYCGRQIKNPEGEFCCLRAC